VYVGAGVGAGVGREVGEAAGGAGGGVRGATHAAALKDRATMIEPRKCMISPSSRSVQRTLGDDVPMGKKRLDQLLVDRGLAESRTRAQALVMAGLVFSGETKLAKSGQTLAEDAPIEVRGRDHPWVSRGGIKLAHALDVFALDPAGAVAMVIGSSTGGFTDVLLQRGARQVFAVDSGTNQLAWKLRQDPRVTVLEQTSARILTPALIDAACDWIVCDASFIGLAKVLARPLALAAPDCRLVALIKPQFEVGREEVGKGGVVRSPELHARVCAEVREWLETIGWTVDGLATSPITGPEGNTEFLIAARRGHIAPAAALGQDGAGESTEVE
jgi:23S rRNA (cytidine1920-2'-O)/16S rRNA (cytidine1409-2'-O)-methyltransferase